MAFNIYEPDKFRAQLSWAWKKFYKNSSRQRVESDRLILAAAWEIQQFDILTSVDSDEPLQPPF